MKIALVHALLIAGRGCFPTYFDTHIEGTTKIMGVDFDASCQCSSKIISYLNCRGKLGTDRKGETSQVKPRIHT
jgi:hypothetical protein